MAEQLTARRRLTAEEKYKARRETWRKSRDKTANLRISRDTYGKWNILKAMCNAETNDAFAMLILEKWESSLESNIGLVTDIPTQITPSTSHGTQHSTPVRTPTAHAIPHHVIQEPGVSDISGPDEPSSELSGVTSMSMERYEEKAKQTKGSFLDITIESTGAKQKDVSYRPTLSEEEAIFEDDEMSDSFSEDEDDFEMEMSIRMVRSYQCVVCNKRVKEKNRRRVSEQMRKILKHLGPLNPATDDVICDTCRRKYQRAQTKTTCTPRTPTIDNDDPDYKPKPSTSRKLFQSPLSITLKIPSTSRSHSRCFVCKRPGPKLVSLSAEGRLSTFLEHNIIIPADSRCCPVHINEGSLKQAAVDNIQTITEASNFSRTSVHCLLQQMRSLCLQQNNSLNFDTLNEVDYPSLTLLTRPQFDDLYSHLSDKLKNTPNRSSRTSLGIFLLKLSSGMSNRLLSTIFGITKSSIRRAVCTVRQAFMRSFVPLYLGFESLTRRDIICKYTRPLAQNLFGSADDQVILVLDGTYIYINKSNNFRFQRRTYSVHKGRPLVKPMVVVTTTGYFVTIVGPYMSDSKNNDAAILNHMLRTNTEDIRGFLKEGDVFIVDRGFRDSLALLKDLGIQAEMPTIIPKGQKQMTTNEANTSRLVTKVRWVVESANSRIKRFKYLSNVMSNSQLPFIGDFVRIACALSNKYLPPISSPTHAEEDEEVAKGMLAQRNKTNELMDLVEEKGFGRKMKVWKTVKHSAVDDFPRFTQEKLRELTLGVYQLRMSSSYIQEHLEGNADVFVHVDEPGLLCIKMQSRHTSNKRYLMWIRHTDSAINAWYCQCKAGSRTVGMCSHLAAIIWYLSDARYEHNPKLGIRDWSVHLADAASMEVPVADDSSSESD